MEKGDINNSKKCPKPVEESAYLENVHSQSQDDTYIASEEETKATAKGITEQGETKACTDPVNKNETEQSDENIYENIADYLK